MRGPPFGESGAGVRQSTLQHLQRGNSAATKVTSGYTHVFDSQCGYTVASTRALRAIDLDRVFPRYGYPNDLLSHFHIAGMRVLDVPVRPVYGPAWKSGIGKKAKAK